MKHTKSEREREREGEREREREGWFQVTSGITLNNVTPPNNLLLN